MANILTNESLIKVIRDTHVSYGYILIFLRADDFLDIQQPFLRMAARTVQQQIHVCLREFVVRSRRRRRRRRHENNRKRQRRYCDDAIHGDFFDIHLFLTADQRRLTFVMAVYLFKTGHLHGRPWQKVNRQLTRNKSGVLFRDRGFLSGRRLRVKDVKI